MKFVIAFLVALLVFLVLKVMRIGLKRLANLYPQWNFRTSLSSVTEFIVWLVFIFWATNYLFKDHFYYPFLVYALIFIVVGFLAWFLIRDIIAGIVFKVKHNLKTGSHIRAGELSGNIKSQQITYLKIRTDDGQLLRIPYSRINREIISELTHTESVEEHSIHIQVEPGLSMADAETLIRETILNSPWSNLKEEPSIKLVKESEEGAVYEILLFSMNRKHMKFIEMALGDIPSVKILS